MAQDQVVVAIETDKDEEPYSESMFKRHITLGMQCILLFASFSHLPMYNEEFRRNDGDMFMFCYLLLWMAFWIMHSLPFPTSFYRGLFMRKVITLLIMSLMGLCIILLFIDAIAVDPYESQIATIYVLIAILLNFYYM
jgi:hypothetical protein